MRYAQTIQSSGNDLLTLINDILDLSKIEAGHMEIKPEPLALARLTRDLTNLFSAGRREEESGVPDRSRRRNAQAYVETDGQRLEQVLRNLLSNAFKFTEQGKVELSVRARPRRPDRALGRGHRHRHLRGQTEGRV